MVIAIGMRSSAATDRRLEPANFPEAAVARDDKLPGTSAAKEER
jgi:hypothetical protein